jgi:predicted metalloprotease with PDZ domain
LSALASPALPAIRIQLDIDATDITHGIQHAHLTIPVHPGPMTLAYPKWVPGEHGPNGPITQLVDLHIQAAARELAWRRDPLDAFAFHIDVPRGVQTLDVRFDYLSPPRPFGPGFGKSPNVTPHLQVIAFSQLVLYPADAPAGAVRVEARVHIPPGWRFDGALARAAGAGGDIALPAVPLTTLADSPILAGEFFRTIPLTQGEAAVRLSIAGDRPADLAVGARHARGPAQPGGGKRRRVRSRPLSPLRLADGAERRAQPRLYHRVLTSYVLEIMLRRRWGSRDTNDWRNFVDVC